MISINALRKKQQGVVTLFATVGLLLATTVVTFSGMKSVANDQRVSANHYRHGQALSASEAGIEDGFSYVEANANTIVKDSDNDGSLDSLQSYTVSHNNGSQKQVYDSPTTQGDGTSYTVSMTNPVQNDLSLLELTSLGKSSDVLANRTVKQRIKMHSELEMTPISTVEALDRVTISGNAEVCNMGGDTTVVSGDNVILLGAGHTTSSNGGSNMVLQGNDIQDNDATLAAMSNNDFFERYFGRSESAVQQGADLVYSSNGNTSYNDQLNGVTSKVIWITQTGNKAYINSSTQIGTADEPVILIVDGNFTMQGSAKIYGFVFVANGNELTLSGSAEILGGAASSGELTVINTGKICYDSSVFNTINYTLGHYAKVAGSWHDF